MDLIGFREHFHIEIFDSEKVVLLSEDSYHLLQGQLYVELARLLSTGPKSTENIFTALKKNYNDQTIQTAIDRLMIKAFITKYQTSTPKSDSGFWSALSLETLTDLNISITVKNFSREPINDLTNALERLSLNVTDEGDFFLIVVDNYISKELELFNAERVVDGKPWMIVKPNGRSIWLGPIFDNRFTGCWTCLSEKLKENRRVELDLYGNNNDKLNISSLATLPTTTMIAMNLVATEVAKWVKSPQTHQLLKHMLTFDMGTLELRFHSFKRLVDCKTCKLSVEPSPRLRFNLATSPKKYHFNEGERSCSLEETYDRLKDIVSPFTGVVSAIRHTIVNEEHICYTVRTLPIPKNFDSEQRCLRIPDVATGKGKTKLQALVGCLAEAIERYNCSFSDQREIRCSFNEIKEYAIHPDLLLNFSSSQYGDREKINVNRTSFNTISAPYDNSKIGWTAVYSLTHDRIKYVPSSFCYLYYPVEKDTEMCPGNSNGCASGNTKEEALFYALMELIERDAVAIWWYNRIKRPSINLEKLNDPVINKLIEKFKANHRTLFVLDLTTDIQVPCYVAVSWRTDGSEIFFGTGAHINPFIGVSKAISELNQVMIRSNTPKNINLDTVAPFERDLVQWVIQEKIEDHPHLEPEGEKILPPNFTDSKDFLYDIQTCLKLLNDAGLEVLVHDLTNPNISFYTIRAIVPGLRHFWSRLGPGRLYDVPVHLGWLSKPLDESSMNPIPYFL